MEETDKGPEPPEGRMQTWPKPKERRQISRRAKTRECSSHKDTGTSTGWTVCPGHLWPSSRAWDPCGHKKS